MKSLIKTGIVKMSMAIIIKQLSEGMLHMQRIPSGIHDSNRSWVMIWWWTCSAALQPKHKCNLSMCEQTCTKSRVRTTWLLLVQCTQLWPQGKHWESERNSKHDKRVLKKCLMKTPAKNSNLFLKEDSGRKPQHFARDQKFIHSIRKYEDEIWMPKAEIRQPVQHPQQGWLLSTPFIVGQK